LYSSDIIEPPHDDREVKIWLSPIALQHHHGYRSRELAQILRLAPNTEQHSSRPGMTTSARREGHLVAARSVGFLGDGMSAALADGRVVNVPLRGLPWLRWLAEASPEQRSSLSLEPGGFAIYGEDLDDGFEVEHLLSTKPIA
jgi:hypothetical protein